MSHDVFIAGGTGYVGSRLIPELLRRGHLVRALARPASASTLPPQCEVVVGNALDGSSYAQRVAPSDTFVHLVGVPHPNPSKARQFVEVDLRAATEAAHAASAAGVRHFVFVSVARPAPVMRAYQDARERAEDAIRATGLSTTILRPWYVLGPGHRWPLVLVPMYWMFERLPATRDTARRLGLVTVGQMVATLADAVETPADGVRILGVPDIRARH